MDATERQARQAAIAIANTPQPWEGKADYATTVASVVTQQTHRHMMAPREARAVLIVAGILLDEGMPIGAILDRMMGGGVGG